MAWHWGQSTSAGGCIGRWLSLCCARDLLFFRFGSAPIFKTPFFSSYSTRYYFSSASFDQRGAISRVGKNSSSNLIFKGWRNLPRQRLHVSSTSVFNEHLTSMLRWVRSMLQLPFILWFLPSPVTLISSSILKSRVDPMGSRSNWDTFISIPPHLPA